MAKRTVRIGALMPLHPAWGQVASLNQVSVQVQNARSLAAQMQISSLPLPAPFKSPETVPASLEQERRKRIAEDAQRRIERRREDLRRNNEDILRNEERAAQKELEARLAAAKSASEKSLPLAMETISLKYERLLYPLGFKEKSFLSQTRAFTGSALADAQAQLNAVRAEQLRLQQERDKLQEDAKTQAQQKLNAQKKQLAADVAARLAKRRQDLEKLAASQIEREEASLSAEAEPVPALGNIIASTPNRSLNALPQPPDAPVLHGQVATAQARIDAALTAQRSLFAAQKARLLEIIQADTEKAAEQIFRKQGWTLVPENTRGAADETEFVASALRAQWKP